jgi:hypothetical protein
MLVTKKFKCEGENSQWNFQLIGEYIPTPLFLIHFFFGCQFVLASCKIEPWEASTSKYVMLTSS